MKNIFIWLYVVLILFTGCSVARKSTQSEISQKDKSGIDITSTENSFAENTGTVESNVQTDETSEKITVHTEYDTSLPPDSVTGSSPIKSSTRIYERKGKKEIVKQSESIKKADYKDVANIDKTKNNIETSIKEHEKNIQRKPETWIIIVCLFLGSIALLINKIIRR